MKYLYTMLMRLGLLAVALVMTAVAGQAQALSWQTVLGTVGNHNAQVNSIAADASGNLILVGFFNGQMDLGNGIVLNGVFEHDAFVAKWSPTAQRFVWALKVGGTLGDYIEDVAVQGSSIYVVGGFNSPTITFGNTTLTRSGTGGSSNTRGDLFIAKLTDAGNSAGFTWALRAGGIDDDYAEEVAVSGNNVYLAGYYQSAGISFGSTPSLPNYSYNDGLDGFVAKVTDAGPTASFTWAQRISAETTDVATALAVQGSSVYVAGYLGSSTTPARLGTLTVPVVGSTDGFVAKLTDAGASSSFTWVKTTAGAAAEDLRDIVVSGSSIYAVGSFSGASLALGATMLTNAGTAAGRDAMVLKITDVGATASFVWAKSVGGTGGDYAYSLAVDGSRMYVVGSFTSPSLTVGTTLLANVGSSDVWLARLTDAGTTSSFSGALRAGGVRADIGYAVIATPGGACLGGYAGPPATFGSLSVPDPSPFQVAFLGTVTDMVLATRTPTGSELTLFPNPAHGRATVQLPAGTGPATLTVLDALGRPVRTYTTASASAELDLTGLAPGVYAVRVAAGAGTATQRLLVE